MADAATGPKHGPHQVVANLFRIGYRDGFALVSFFNQPEDDMPATLLCTVAMSHANAEALLQCWANTRDQHAAQNPKALN